MKILLPDTLDLDPTLPDGWNAAVIDAREPIPAEHRDAQAIVIWGASRRHLTSAAEDLPALRLVQSLSAGVEGILAAGFREDVVIATGAGLHSATVSEHTLALLLALVRRLPEARAAQERGHWSRELGGLQPLHPAGRITTLLGARVLIWGFGEIARTLAPLLAALGAEVRGVARSAGERDGFAVIAQEDVASELPRTDVLIDILPGGEGTAGAIDAAVISALPDHALLVNVGRGTTVDPLALREALEAGTLGGAALDVTDPEPLPEDDPLWQAPRLLITPHAAGGRPVGADHRITQNLRALVEGTEVLHRA